MSETNETEKSYQYTKEKDSSAALGMTVRGRHDNKDSSAALGMTVRGRHDNKDSSATLGMTSEKACHFDRNVSGAEKSLNYIFKKMKKYYVYILTNFTNTTLYIGVTGNIERRMYEHKNGLLEGFTKKYNVDKLVYAEECNNINDALAREKQLKKWRREKKEMLINSINPDWKDLMSE